MKRKGATGKKLLTFILVGIMVLGIAGCGNSSAEKDGESEEKHVITYYSWVGDAEKKFVQTMIAQYEADHPDVRINDNYVPYGEYLSKLSTLEASGEMPDVFQLIEGKVFEWGNKGALLDLKPLFEDAGIDPETQYASNGIFDDGEHIYGVGNGLFTMCLYYNKEMLRENGIEFPSSDADHPWTWDQFEQAAIKLTRDSDGKCPTDKGFNKDDIAIYGTVMPANWTKLLALLRTNGTSFASEDGRTFNLTSPEAVEVIQRILDLSQKDYCAPDYSVGSNLEANIPALIMNGQVAMMIEGSWNLPNYTNEGYDIGVAQIPIFREPANVSWASSYCMPPKAADNQIAFDFLSYMTNDENSLNACQKNHVSPSSIPQTRSILDTDEGMQQWVDSYDKVDESANCEALRNIIEQENTTLGENVTLKNFNIMMNNKIFPAIENVWLKEKTPEEAFGELDLSEELNGIWR